MRNKYNGYEALKFVLVIYQMISSIWPNVIARSEFIFLLFDNSMNTMTRTSEVIKS